MKGYTACVYIAYKCTLLKPIKINSFYLRWNSRNPNLEEEFVPCVILAMKPKIRGGGAFFWFGLSQFQKQLFANINAHGMVVMRFFAWRITCGVYKCIVGNRENELWVPILRKKERGAKKSSKEGGLGLHI